MSSIWFLHEYLAAIWLNVTCICQLIHHILKFFTDIIWFDSFFGQTITLWAYFASWAWILLVRILIHVWNIFLALIQLELAIIFLYHCHSLSFFFLFNSLLNICRLETSFGVCCHYTFGSIPSLSTIWHLARYLHSKNSKELRFTNQMMSHQCRGTH